MKSPEAQDYTVGVVGCGAMGQGIAQVSAQGGMRTILFDARDGGAETARNKIAGHIKRMTEKGRVTEAEAASAIDCLEVAPDLSGLAPCDTVVEAIFEDIDVKHSVFKDLEAVVRSDCILASNTSSIPIASIARVCEHRDRIGGFHFFNPVPLMKLVEVIRAAQTSDQTVANLMALGKRMTRVPVEVKDSPGFLVNMGGRAYTTEALRIVHEGVATPEQVDAIMRDCWGFRMGPFELMDLTGIDVNYPVSQIIWEGYGYDPRIKTSPNHKAMFDAGLYGRKTDQGWFKYKNGKPLDRPSPDFETDARPVSAVCFAESIAQAWWIKSIGEDGSSDLRQHPSELDPSLYELTQELGIEVVEDDGVVPIISAQPAVDCVDLVQRFEIDRKRIFAIDLLGDTSKRITMSALPGCDIESRDGFAAAIMNGGRDVTLISDSVGFVGQRMVSMVANLGCYMAEIGLASPEDIDTAMQLGLNYPQGSIALADTLGPETCLKILAGLQDMTGDDRYRPTQWLRRRAALGLSVYTPG